jgi:hypothetical protein
MYNFEKSTVGASVGIKYAFACIAAKQPNLKLKIQLKQQLLLSIVGLHYIRLSG